MGGVSHAMPSGRGSLWKGLVCALGFGRGKRADAGTADAGTQLAYERTDLAVERSALAAERTLMAWIRTTLSMISFGFTLGKLGQTVEQFEVKGWFQGPRLMSVEGVAYALVVVGTTALAAAIVQYLARIAVYAEMGLRARMSVPVVVGLVLVLLGGFAFTALVARL